MPFNFLWLFLTVPWVSMQCVIVVFPGHTQLPICPQWFMMEDGLALSDSGSESALRVKADWNCFLQILALSFVSVLRIPFLRNTFFMSDLANDQNFLTYTNQRQHEENTQNIGTHTTAIIQLK